jgi:hypothetical protein
VTITNSRQAQGSWAINLKAGTPLDVLGRLAYLGHIAISVGRPDPRVSGDSLLKSARYVGPLRKITFSDDGFALSGVGMPVWMGDENDKGPIITDTLFFQGTDFVSTVNQLLAQAPSVKAGNITNAAVGYTGFHQFVTVRKALDFVCSTVTTDITDPVEWRVNGDGSVDAGKASTLYQYDPITVIARREPGTDMAIRSLPGKAAVDEDIEDYATEVILLGQGEGLGVSSAQAKLDNGQIPYKDIFGNTVRIARTVSQSSTDAANSLVQAQIALNQSANPRDAVTLSTSQFDIEGDLRVGDGVWVYDPAAGLVDSSPQANEMIFRGERINPVKLRVSELTWPVEAGMSVAFRTPDGQWLDLTDYVAFETGDTTVTVGGYDRSLTNPSGRQESLGSRAAPNTSVPDVPTFLTTAFVQAVYQSTQFGVTKAQIQLRWIAPHNTDGTTIIDGDHYEIRYRTATGSAFRQVASTGTPSNTVPGAGLFPGVATFPGSTLVGGSAAVIPPGFPSTWGQCAGLQWDQMSTWAQPIELIAGPWLTAYAAFDTNSLLIQELTPAVPYEFEIRAVDNGVPPNYSQFSDPVEVIMRGDDIPPPTPAPPEVASSLIAIQITHRLGAAAGGTFNLPADMHHFEVHVGPEPLFTASAATLIGKLNANNGMIVSQTPVVGTLNINDTVNIYVRVVAVDEAGNRSNPSVAVQASAQLIDDEHVSNLSVSKVIAGEITADWLVGASIQTAKNGARAGLDAAGLFAYNAQNARCWEVQDATGDMVAYGPLGVPSMRIQASTGNVFLYKTDGVTPAMTLTASAGLLELFGKVTSGSGVGLGPTAVVDPSSDNPSFSLYPDSSLKRFEMSVDSNLRPDGSDGAVVQFQARNESGQPDGFGIWSWASNAWMGMQTTAGAWNPVIIQQQVGGGLYLQGTFINITSGFQGSGGIHLDAQGSQFLAGSNANNYLQIISNDVALVKNGAVKSFVIDHPTDDARYLVHGCIEAPEAQVEYRGTAIIEDGMAVVELPSYFEAATVPDTATVHLTAELAAFEGKPMVCVAAPSEVRGGRFHIVSHGPDGSRVHWLVKATRADVPQFDVEPKRADVRRPWRRAVPLHRSPQGRRLMATLSPRFSFTLPDPADTVDITKLNADFVTIDNTLGLTPCTLGTRPSSPIDGQAIYERDTHDVLVWDASVRCGHVALHRTGHQVCRVRRVRDQRHRRGIGHRPDDHDGRADHLRPGRVHRLQQPDGGRRGAELLPAVGGVVPAHLGGAQTVAATTTAGSIETAGDHCGEPDVGRHGCAVVGGAERHGHHRLGGRQHRAELGAGGGDGVQHDAQGGELAAATAHLTCGYGATGAGGVRAAPAAAALLAATGKCTRHNGMATVRLGGLDNAAHRCNVCGMAHNSAPLLPRPIELFSVLVDSHVGLISIDVWAHDYATAYRGAVEQMLIDPHGTVLHRMRQILSGE